MMSCLSPRPLRIFVVLRALHTDPWRWSPAAISIPDSAVQQIPVTEVDGGGCGTEALRNGAGADPETMAQFAKDYPKGPTTSLRACAQPSAPCAWGCACGARRPFWFCAACCVYGLTFTSHFYGARRSVGYVPFNSETLVTGKLFEDIKEAVERMADPALYDAIVVTNLCVPTASGVPLRLLPKAINGVRIIGIDVPGFGVPTRKS